MAQLTRKVTFDADGMPSPRIIAVGTVQDNNARLIQFAAPAITDNQQVYINLQVGDVSDTVRLYADDEGLYGWSVAASTLVKFGNGKAQLKIVDASDPLQIKWQSGNMGLSIGAALDVDADLSYKYPTAIEQIEAEMQRVETATAQSQQAAAQSQQAALASQQAAAQSEQAALASENEAAKSQQAAAASAEAALASQQAAAKSADDAALSTADAEKYAQAAQESAENAAAIVTGDLDIRYVQLTDYEDADVLNKIKNVDGAASGLDADLLDGYHAQKFIDDIASKASSSHTHAQSDITGLETALSTINTTLAGKASSSHTHAAGNITAGTLAGRVQANATAVGTLANAQVRNIIIATSAPSSANNGDVWLSYT